MQLSGQEKSKKITNGPNRLTTIGLLMEEPGNWKIGDTADLLLNFDRSALRR